MKSCFLQEDIVVNLPELVPDFNDMEPPKVIDDMYEFKIKMRETGRIIRYTIPYDVYLMMKQKYEKEG